MHGISISPDPVTVEAGRTVAISAGLTYVGAEVLFQSNESSIATVAGKIDRGATGATLKVTGVAVGETDISYTIPNFGRAPGSGIAGRIIVTPRTDTPPPPCAAPRITTQPVPATITRGARAELFVRASGTTPREYQWFSSTRPIAGATDWSYTTPPLDTVTEYYVRLTNACGSVESDRARITMASVRRRASRS